MTYYIHLFLFYLLGVADSLKVAGEIFSAVLCGALVVYLIYCACEGEELNKKAFRNMIIGFILSLSVAILTPSREVCQEMIISSVVTHENVNGAIENTKELVDYIVDKVNETESDNDND